MAENPKHVTVRLRVPPELRDKISKSSEQYNRSMNADMVARLEQSFEAQISHEFEIHVMEIMLKEQQDKINSLIQSVDNLTKIVQGGI
ncbi:MAG TPA: toxin-antitoxin system HicB family antitoxin [Acinetobacter ursingii]|uniref:Toxin-antitoxin system HicB family antitoxin n=1 Tax=Acinetobacter ursingii TaxID=108980 RepID=A0A3D2SQV8_9GAMM|nr:Arc family DNA-binding protein [Acinetobacter guerrae]MPW44798.1 DNA-binding protein [Acinetobacter guerrae]HCK31104.1 toxin-antitoxin system HicB family antitoxin [Acinetobacter ursingii]